MLQTNPVAHGQLRFISTKDGLSWVSTDDSTCALASRQPYEWQSVNWRLSDPNRASRLHPAFYHTCRKKAAGPYPTAIVCKTIPTRKFPDLACQRNHTDSTQGRNRSTRISICALSFKPALRLSCSLARSTSPCTFQHITISHMSLDSGLLDFKPVPGNSRVGRI